METDQVRASRAAAATVVAELVYTRGDTGLAAVVVTPLVDDGRIVLALPYAEAATAERLAAAGEVCLTLSDDRMALRGWEPLAITGRIEVTPDPEGERFQDELMEQELGKHPPTRLLVDSLRDRRDHWWYLPRLLCHLEPSVGIRAVGRRSGPTTGVLAWRGSSGLDVETVEVIDAEHDQIRVRALSGRELRGAGDPAVLFRHDYSQPDLERRAARRESGRLAGAALRGVEREGELALPAPYSLLERMRRFRALSKACRRELARAR